MNEQQHGQTIPTAQLNGREVCDLQPKTAIPDFCDLLRLFPRELLIQAFKIEKSDLRDDIAAELARRGGDE